MRYLGIPNLPSNLNINLWWMVSNTLTRPTKITQVSSSCSLFNCRIDLIEYEPSGQQVFGDDPIWKGIPSTLKADWSLQEIIIDITLEVTSNKLIPLQLLVLDRSPFFDSIFKFFVCHSGILMFIVKTLTTNIKEYFDIIRI